MNSNHVHELQAFLEALYEPDDIVELRPIERWTDRETGARQSRALRRQWLAPKEIVARRAELEELNTTERANIFMGVNPRPAAGLGKKADIRICRSLWADFDNISTDAVGSRLRSKDLPEPSILIRSGSGVHAYWLLEAPYRIRATESRRQFEAVLQSLLQELSADATQDVSRLLRLPGFSNVKHARNGRSPLPCSLVRCESAKRYAFDLFSARIAQEGREGKAEKKCPSRALPPAVRSTDAPSLLRENAKARAVLARLERATSDRSRRDYAVICDLIRLGLSQEDIWSLVSTKSKFAVSGFEYFQTTFLNARKELGDVNP